MAKQNKKLQKQVKQTINNVNVATIVVAVICLLVGIFGGFFGYKTFTKNDTFELVGDKEITISLGGQYEEHGAKIIAFGKDVSLDVEISGEVNTNEVGEYVITYTINNFKYKGVKKVRVITVVEE